jgi:hypothetical protein
MSEWTKLVSSVYKDGKSKNKSFSLKQAMMKAKTMYKNKSKSAAQHKSKSRTGGKRKTRKHRKH